MWHTRLSRRRMLASLGSGTLAVTTGFDTKETEVRQVTEVMEEMEEMEEMEVMTAAESDVIYDVIVVGGSYAGLSAAMQLVRGRRRVLILDTEAPRNRFARASHGFFGQDGRAPREMIETARRQVLAYPTAHFRRAEATGAAREKDQFLVTCRDGSTARARRLILATGITDHLPDVSGIKELWGTGVAHCPYCHGYEVAGRRIAVLGSGEAGIHQALLLRDWSDDVTLLTHGAPAPTGAEGQQLTRRGVKVETAPIARLIAREKEKELEAVAFADGRRLPFGALFTATRWSLTSPLAEMLGCEIDRGNAGPLVKTDAFKESTVSGVYVAGDAARLYGNATLASADGVVAGGATHRSLIFGKKPS